MPDLVAFTEEKTVDHYFGRITNLIERLAASALGVARELADAEASLSRHDFKELRQRLRISYSTVRKLIKVGRSDRIKQYENKLARIDAWSTLHEIEKLGEAAFEKFRAEFLAGETPSPVTRADVERFKKTAKPKTFSLVATIEVDTSRTPLEDVFSIEKETEKLKASLARFRGARVDVKGLATRLEVRSHDQERNEIARITDERQRARRQALRQFVNKQIAKMPGPNRKKQFEKHWGISMEEIFDPNIDPNSILVGYFGEEPVEP